MHKFRRLFLSLCAIVLIVGVITPFYMAQPIRAQGTDNTVTISLAVPQFADSVITPKLIEDFESSHPGVKLNIVKQSANVPSAAEGLDKHFEAVQKYVQSADVLYVSDTNISTEATRAGYYLDLMPLASEDKTLNPDDFFPAVWQSFQWDRGLWAVPIAADPFVITYNPDTFDKAGLAYPNDKWTITDLTDAARKLAEKDANGKVTKAGIDVQQSWLPFMLRGMIDQSFYDSSTIPNTPKFATPEIAAVLDEWYKLDSEGYVGQEFGKAPLAVAPAIFIALQPQVAAEEKRTGVLFPGGKSTISVQGVAVSAGTQYPEQAYQLAAWLTTRADIANNGFASTPARKSLLGKTDTNTQAFQLNIPAEVQKLVDDATVSAIPLSELRFADYIAAAYAKMKTDKIDATTALQTAEGDAVKAQTLAAEKKSAITGSLVVATPVPSTSADGKITLKFGVNTFSSPLPNKDQWDKAIADFVAGDAQVGQVTLEASLDTLPQASTKYDCFYLSYNDVPGGQVTNVLNLDPYLAADPTFDKADLVGNVLTQVQRSNQTFALPIDIQPNVLKYDTEQVSKAGVTVPAEIMSVDQFTDMLKQLKPNSSDPAPFVPANTAGSYILSLAAAYGGLPFDFRTNPMTINFTDAKTVTAIKQVLDLAKQGYIKYKALGGTQMDISPFVEPGILTQDSLGAFAFRMPGTTSGIDEKHKIMLYPKGTDFTAITYALGTAYISAKTQNADACYRFISAISRNVNLFSAMPVRRSMINDPALATAQNADVVGLYQQIDALLQDPNSVAIPTISFLNQGSVDILYYLWLNRAFDAYVTKDADLEAALKDAEIQAKTFQECSVNIPAFDQGSVDAQRAWLKAFKDCALKADPTLKPLLDMIKTE